MLRNHYLEFQSMITKMEQCVSPPIENFMFKQAVNGPSRRRAKGTKV